MSFLGFAVYRLIGIGFFIQQVFNQEAGLSFFLISAKTDLKSSPSSPESLLQIGNKRRLINQQIDFIHVNSGQDSFQGRIWKKAAVRKQFRSTA